MIWDQHYWWKLRSEYAFGFIVPLFVLYILYERWPALSDGLLAGDPGTGDAMKHESRSGLTAFLQWTALLMLMGGLCLFFVGALYRAMEGQNLISSNCMAFGYANILLGGAFVYLGNRRDGSVICLRERWHLTLLFLFPALIWMLSVPMFNAIEKIISTFLMNKVAIVVHYVFDVLGFSIIREGSILQLPRGDVGVEDACSGIRSLMACLFAGSFLGSVYFTVLWKKILLVASAMLLAFINNIFRSIFLTGWAYRHGPQGLEDHVNVLGFDFGNVHDFTGWVVLGLTVLGLLVLVKVFSIRLEYTLPEEELR